MEKNTENSETKEQDIKKDAPAAEEPKKTKKDKKN